MRNALLDSTELPEVDGRGEYAVQALKAPFRWPGSIAYEAKALAHEMGEGGTQPKAGRVRAHGICLKQRHKSPSPSRRQSATGPSLSRKRERDFKTSAGIAESVGTGDSSIRSLDFVMRGLDPRIHVGPKVPMLCVCASGAAWMAGSSPAMTWWGDGEKGSNHPPGGPRLLRRRRFWVARSLSRAARRSRQTASSLALWASRSAFSSASKSFMC
jgi:hypothetical protein